MFDPSAFLSSLMFCVANAVDAVYYAKFRNRAHFNYQKMRDLDPQFIRDEFDFREEVRGLEILSNILNAIAWFSLIAPIFQLSWLLSQGGKQNLSASSMLCALVIGGSAAEFLSTLMFLGSSNASEWMAKSFNLDSWLSNGGNEDIGWRVLEMGQMMLRGTRLWIDAIEWIFLYVIMTIIFVTNLRSQNRLFSMRWVGYGLFVAALCIVDFAADILRFEDWRTFSRIAFITSIALRIFLLPIWLLGLSMGLPAAQKKSGLVCQMPEPDAGSNHVSSGVQGEAEMTEARQEQASPEPENNSAMT